MQDGKDDRIAKQLQTKKVNAKSGPVNNGEVHASAGRNSNHINVKSTNKISGKGINDRQFNDQMVISKGKGIMENSASDSYNQENGAQQSSVPKVFSSLSKAIGDVVEGRRFTSEKGARGASGNAESSDRNSDRTNIQGGSQAPNDRIHCFNEKPAEPSIISSSTYTRTSGMKYIFG